MFQYLVTEKKAYFEYISSSIIDLLDIDEINIGDAADDKSYDDGESIYDNGVAAANAVDEEQATSEESIYNGVMVSNAVDEEQATSVGSPDASAEISNENYGEESGYSKFCLERNEVVEGTMSRITGPTSLTLVIMKIGGVDLSVAKNKMHNEMSDKCSTLLPLNHIIPGMKRKRMTRAGVVGIFGESNINYKLMMKV